ncbi:MAG: hypothetical protein H8E25_15315 [Planctomycetes bacterium]|nr:hypothetical protein [Planctomycetota bacterium]
MPLEWVSGKIQLEDGSIAFVGRGGGANVLDERHAFDEALDHIRTQVAKYIATRVIADGCLEDSTDWHPGLDKSTFRNDGESQAVQHRAHQISRALVGGISVSDQYWEQWDVYARNAMYDFNQNGGVQSTPRYGTVRRYKCWVLTYISQETMDTYIASTLASIESESHKNQKAMESAVAKSNTSAARLAQLQNEMRIEAYELQRLRERVNYGRRFRLVAQEDCGHATPSCDFEQIHPDWRVITPTPVPAVSVAHHDASCQSCGITTSGN